MGMFDWYKPRETLYCRVCGEPLGGYQGKDAENLLLEWTEGFAAPTRHLVDDEIQFNAEVLETFRLPEEFEFYGWCDSPAHRGGTDFHLFAGRCVMGVWQETVPISEEELSARRLAEARGAATEAPDRRSRLRRLFRR